MVDLSDETRLNKAVIIIAQVVTYKLNLLIFRSGDLKTAFYRDTSA
jgi:hypothetical protein